VPYQRPPLSKQYLAGKLERHRLLLRKAEYFESKGVELRLGRRVVGIDRQGKRATLDSGEALRYDWLVLATGSRLRRRVMSRVAGARVAGWLAEKHRESGVRIRTQAEVSAFVGNGRVEGVETDGGSMEADAVVVGIGALPASSLARECGLKEDDGIRTDEYCRTEDESILAAGDCARTVNTLLGTAIRLESVQNAVDHGQVAASVILGRPKAYSSTPWFWSDQYRIKLQIAGMAAPGDETVLRGDPGSGAFAAFRLRGGRLSAVEAVSSPREFMAGKQMIAARASPDPALLADTSVPLKDLLPPR